MRVIVAAALLATLAGCGGTTFQSRPISVGGGPNSLRRTPCACNEIKQQPGLPEFMQTPQAAKSAA